MLLMVFVSIIHQCTQLWGSAAGFKDHGSEEKAKSVAKHEAAGNAPCPGLRRWVPTG